MMHWLFFQGLRTGYIYRRPLVKQETTRVQSDVALPPTASNYTHLFDEDDISRRWDKDLHGRDCYLLYCVNVYFYCLTLDFFLNLFLPFFTSEIEWYLHTVKEQFSVLDFSWTSFYLDHIYLSSSPLKRILDGRKTQDKTRWLNSPNVYQKVEVLETGTPDPKKITKVELITVENK